MLSWLPYWNFNKVNVCLSGSDFMIGQTLSAKIDIFKTFCSKTYKLNLTVAISWKLLTVVNFLSALRLKNNNKISHYWVMNPSQRGGSIDDHIKNKKIDFCCYSWQPMANSEIIFLETDSEFHLGISSCQWREVWIIY